MPNLRVIHDNAADRATLSASSTAGTLVAANMLTDIKGQVHRSTGTSVSYTLTWAAEESIGGVALPATNLTATATVRLRAYDAVSGGALLADTGTLDAVPGPGIELWDWALPLNSNAFAFGGVAKCSVWLAEHVAARRLVIDVVDTANPAAYIDCARIVAGAYWELTYNPKYGVVNDTVDATRNTRAQSGDIVSDRAPQYDTLKLDLQYMPPADRARLNQVMRGNGVCRNLFLSLLPGNADPLAEQDLQIYGRRQNGGVTFDFFEAHSAQITVEGW